MRKLSRWSMLFAFSSVLLACGDGSPGGGRTDGGDAAAGTTAAGTGGIQSTGGNGPGSGGLSGTGGKTLGAGGRTLGTGGDWGTGGTAMGSGGVSGAGGVSSGTCSTAACTIDAGRSSNDASDAEDSPAAQACTYNGRTYPEGTEWFAADGCNECTCQGGHAGCSLVPCDADAGGRPSYSCGSYSYGVTFPSADGCNICECGFYWYRVPVGSATSSVLVSCTLYDCSGSPVGDAGFAGDGGIDACVYDGKTYPVDSYFLSADGCDQCHCRTDGQITCTFQHGSCR